MGVRVQSLPRMLPPWSHGIFHAWSKHSLFILVITVFQVGGQSNGICNKRRVVFDGEEFEILNDKPSNTLCKPEANILRRVSDDQEFCVAKEHDASTSKVLSCQDCSCGKSKDQTSRILDGTEVPPHFYPWLVYLQVVTDAKVEARCTGSVISKHAMITAAHCVCSTKEICEDKTRWNTVTAHIGAHNRTDPAQILATNLLIHPKHFSGESLNFSYDIALLITEEEIMFNQNVQPVCLPDAQDMGIESENAISAGWGLVNKLGDWLLNNSIPFPDIDASTLSSEKMFEIFTTEFEESEMFFNKDFTLKDDQAPEIDFDKIRDLFKSGIEKKMNEKQVTEMNTYFDEGFKTYKNKFRDLLDDFNEQMKVTEDIGAIARGLNKLIFYNVQKTTDVPKHGLVSVLTKKKCDELLKLESYADMFCAPKEKVQAPGAVPAGQICNGDSGGPLVKKQGERYVLYGISSSDLPSVPAQLDKFFELCNCNCPDWISLFTDVSKLMPWILEHLKQENALPPCSEI